jgi:hypothetical protein
MKYLPNDDFDMCCGSRPTVENLEEYPLEHWKFRATCGICGAFESDNTLSELMIEWNKRQRGKVTE